MLEENHQWFLEQKTDDCGWYPPPWRRYPSIPRFSIGWRMGYGEVYMDGWCQWYDALCDGERSLYRMRYWPPFIWWDFYFHNSRHRWIEATSSVFTLIWVVALAPFLIFAYWFPMILIASIRCHFFSDDDSL